MPFLETSTIIFKEPYDLTQCADSWQLENGSTNDEKVEIIEDWLKTEQEINVKKTTYIENETQLVFCNACSCSTGDVLEVQVDNLFKTQLAKLGFYE